MPTYEYRCGGCKRKFERLQRMSEAPLKKCEKCGGKLERLIGAGAGLIFKGSGFYITDYKKSPATDKKSDAPAKSESKPKTSKKDSD